MLDAKGFAEVTPDRLETVMPRRRKDNDKLTELELEIMQVVWKEKEVTVKKILAALAREGRCLAPPSIRTMLAILQDKDYVTRRPQGRGHVYSAQMPAEQTRKRILKDVIDRAFDGSASSLVAALVNARMVSRRELDKARRLIERHEKGARE